MCEPESIEYLAVKPGCFRGKNRAAASKEPILSWNVSAATGAVYICGGDRETLHTQRRSVV